jgi:DNA replication protein DnaC
VPCPCQVERRIRITIPERYWAAKLSDCSQIIFEQVLAWLLSPTDGLRLCGSVGTGKTHCAAGIVRHIAEQEKPVKFRSFSQIYRDLRECYTLNRNEQDVLRELFKAPFLVLDDLGAGSLSDFERRSVTDILDERMGNLRPTVVTTNWSLKQIEEKMDDRIASRLASFTAIEFSGRDHRIKRAPG